MPKEWGRSGERLKMTLEVKFTSQQLYDKEEFLTGVGGAKVVEVVHNELTLGPTVTRSSRQIPVKSGGWCVAPGEGPSGADLLRFYVDIMEDVKHKGLDVHCPKGRIYCTCGYFPKKEKNTHIKDTIKAQLAENAVKATKLNREMEYDPTFLSWNKVRNTRQLFKLGVENKSLSNALHKEEVRNPEVSRLRFSEDGRVGLSKQGGACCKVAKGMSVEYQILGTFGLGCVSKPVEEANELGKLRP